MGKDELQFGAYRDVGSCTIDKDFEHRTDSHGSIKKCTGYLPREQCLAGDTWVIFDRLRCPIQVLIECASNQDGGSLRIAGDSQIL